MVDDENATRRLEEFSELLAECQPQLLAHAFALVRNTADAEDVCQRSAVVLWRKFDAFEPGSNFHSWALKITQYEALNFIRRRRGERLFFSSETLKVISEAERDEVAAARQQYQGKRLRQCLERLPPRQRDLIRLYYEGTRTISEVAARLRRKEATVRSQLCRIRQTLRKCVEREMPEEDIS